MKPFCKLAHQNLTRVVTISLGITHLIRTQIFRKINISCLLIFRRTFVYQGIKVSAFSGNFAYELRGGSFIIKHLK